MADDKIDKYEKEEGFFLVSVSGSSHSVQQMRNQAKKSRQRVRDRHNSREDSDGENPNSEQSG